MSYRVLVIAEDFRKDQYVLEPLVARMFDAMGKKAKVIVCRDPLLGGVDQALRWERIQEILVRYRAMIECFVLAVDRDGKPGRREILDRLEARAAAELAPGKRLFGENAWQEIEVWLLAGHDLPSDWAWKDERSWPGSSYRSRSSAVFARRTFLSHRSSTLISVHASMRIRS